MYLVSCILIAIALSCHECTALDYLSPGFAHVKLNDGSTETFKVDDYYRVPVALEAFRLTNVPSQVPLQSTTFTLVRGKEINDHSVFFNGQYYIFFLQNVEPHGTWLLGDRLGVDSGVAYLRPDVHTVVPLDMESLTSQWHFLKNGKWVAEKDVRAEPTDVDIVRRISFNSIGYFSGVDDFSSQSVLLMTPVDRSQQNVRNVGGDGDLFRFSPALNIALPSDEFPAEKYPLYWSLETGQWAPFTLLYALPKAAPVRLIASKAMTDDAVSGKTRASSQVVHLVGEEGSSRGWRLFLRVSDKDAGGELELKLTLSRSGLESNYKIKSLKKSVMSTFVKKQNKKVIDLKVGSYVWMWFHSEAETLGKSRYLAFAGDNFLLKCVGKTTTEGVEKYVFEYYHSHRRVAMDRSVLSMHTSLVSAMWNSDTNSLEWSLDGSPLIVDALFSLGPDPVTWLRDYLISHEDFLAPGLSSCFMYHGGLSMPQQLIYAAEMICVLIGSKPMTMIQYTSSADHQWKFPLVPELTQGIVSGRLLLDPLAAGIGVQYNTYQVTSETIIFYRTKQRPMLDLILPNNTAQALHIVPFPSEAGEGDNAKMDRVLREQIYNSWWNGYLLGYPIRFINSYLTGFHTKLGPGAIQEEMQRAQSDVGEHFAKNPQLKQSEIKYGSDVNLLSDNAIMTYFANIA